MKKILVLMLVLLMAVMLTACAMPAVSNPDGSDTVAGVAIKTGLDVVETLCVMLLSVAGAAWAAKCKDKAYLQNINIALAAVENMAKQTVGELKQTVVDGMKATAPDGKLSDQQVEELKKSLLDLTLKKLDTPTKDLLEAAGADLCAIITGAGEDWIRALKDAQPIVLEAIPDSAPPEAPESKD